MIRTLLRRIGVMALTVSLLPACIASAKGKDTASSKELDYLGKELMACSDHMMKTGEDMDDIYSELIWTSVADTFPSKFDLRERNTITPVKMQNPWGTCWSFATIAASETSILNSLGMTVDSYKKKYGEDLDLSEKHLAWFTTKALPELDEYPEGEYLYDQSQAGEGLHFLGNEDIEPLNTGGNFFLATTSLAEGIGILKEKFAPYANSDGKLEKSGDWSLPEKDRYTVSYELKDSNILPTPAFYDDKGNYKYRSEATEAIKTELLAGRAVGISFYADRSMPELSPQEKREQLEKLLKDKDEITKDEKDRYIDARAGITDTADLSKDELKELLELRIRMNGVSKDLYDLDSCDHDELVMLLMTSDFGKEIEVIKKSYYKKPYLTFIEGDPIIYAQYTYENVGASHAVTIVGWDDEFSAENWPEDCRPPGDGVWIAKNSWGEDWGMDGYFLMSYYDMNLCAIESFEYVVSEDHQQMDSLIICGYDKMPAENISSTLFDTPVYAANEFVMEDDSVLEYVSTMTGDINTTVTASIYKLSEDAKSPTDGVLMGSVTETFRFAGYHRINLSDNLLLPKGTKISIVILQNVPVEDGNKYAIVNSSSLNEEGARKFNEIYEKEGKSVARYAKAVVNPGESFISFGNEEWTDWTEAIDHIDDMGSNAYMAYDNLPIKAYVYPLAEVEKVHDLSDKVPAVGGEAAICPEDGYMLLDVTGDD